MANKLEQCAEKLIADRKTAKPPAEYPSKKDLSKYSLKHSLKGSSDVKSVDAVEDVIILASNQEGQCTGYDFDGKTLFRMEG